MDHQNHRAINACIQSYKVDLQSGSMDSYKAAAAPNVRRAVMKTKRDPLISSQQATEAEVCG